MISKYLKTLLADHKRVIIPDFGGFVVKRSAAGDIISFNSFLKFNDDLLANLIVEREGVEKSQALKQLKAFVKEINTSLDDSGKFEILDVGFLIKDKKGNVRFVDAIDDVVASVLPTEKDNEKTQQSEEVPVNVKEEAKENTPKNKEEVPLVGTKGQDKEKKKATPWIIIAVIIIAIGAWAIVQNAVKNEASRATTEQVDSVSTTKSVAGQLADKHNILVEKKANDQINVSVSKDKEGFLKRIISFFKGLFSKSEKPVENDTSEKDTEEPVVYSMQPNQVDTISGILVVADKLISPKGKERYNVIIGSFTEKENAASFNLELIDSGFASEIFDRYNGFEAVSMGSYPSIDIAMKVCGEQLKETPDVWVLVK